MLDVLARLFDDAGRLSGVTHTRFDNARLIVAVGLRFESLEAEFRANPEDDTLVVSLGPGVLGPDESRFEAGDAQPWKRCLGLRLRWAWKLTNHQGYPDGVRLEFSQPDQPFSVV